MAVVTYTQRLVSETCYLCGVGFAMPEDMQANRLEDHKSFWCPNGHSQSYVGKTEEQKQRERAERLERALANRDEDLRSERAAHVATKGQLTKTKKRVANGVCPCCKRSFANLHRHMAGQHPDYSSPEQTS